MRDPASTSSSGPAAWWRRRPGVLALLCWLAWVTGCSEQPLAPGQEAPRPSHRTGRYGPLERSASPSPASASPSSRSLTEAGWTNADLSVVQTELSPALLLRSDSSYLGLFQGLAECGLGGPSFVGFSSRAGPRAFRSGQPFDVIDMEECWVVIWFAGARGWIQWDSPWAVFLQHKPLAMVLDEEGLHFRFRQRAGEVVILPLYGYDKLPPEGGRFEERYDLPQPKPNTADWDKALSREMLMRVRYWAGALRQYPLHCRTEFQINPARDEITLRDHFDFHPIADDWNTPPLKLAPLSPVLALATREQGIPARFSSPVMDLDLLTPYGPYMAAQNVETLDTLLPLLPYIHETERSLPPDPNHHLFVMMAQEQLLATVDQSLSQLAEAPSALLGPLGHAAALARALPYCDPPRQARLQEALRRCLRQSDQSSLQPWQIDLDDPALRALPDLWACAHFTDDWDWLRPHWDRIRSRIPELGRVRWAAYGRENIVPLADPTAPALALARLAYRLGDPDAYEQACHLFARELVVLAAKLRGADYFRHHQPWRSLEAIKPPAWPNALSASPPGWQIDGPHYPSQRTHQLFPQRWIRFQDPDVARFMRDHLKTEAAQEWTFLSQQAADPTAEFLGPNPLLSLVILRSLLGNATADLLAPVAAPHQFAESTRDSVAACLAYLRTSHPVHYQRLIPGAAPGPFVSPWNAGPSDPPIPLVAALDPSGAGESTSPGPWPRLSWNAPWPTPSGHPWSFGQIKVHPESTPGPRHVLTLNRHTQLFLYRFPATNETNP